MTLSRRELLTGPRFEVRLEPGLLDALVQSVRHDPRALPDPEILARHDAAVDRAYRTASGADRRRAIDMENGRLVAHLGLVPRVTQALRDHPAVEARLGRVILAAAAPSDQRADVHGPDASGRLALVVRLATAVWLDAAASERYVQHELTHASDMLDPAFAYDASAAWPGATHGQRSLARERFTALWCASVDARLARAGRAPIATPGVYGAQLRRLYAGASPGELGALIAELTRGPRPTHAGFLARAAARHAAPDAPGECGAPCPLCGFPTSEWAGPAALAGPAATAITADFPAWRRPEGCCARCLECYEPQGRVR